MIYVGTSGYSYDDWVGPYYPADLPKNKRLDFYAQEFNACELNFSYYRIPTPWMLERIAAKTGKGFQFAIKANQAMTHQREENANVFAQFVQALDPLLQAGKFGCVLLQFPSSFRARPENLHYLRLCRERLGDLPAVVEFRHAGWLTDETLAFLRAQNLGFCAVDQPRLRGLLPPVAHVTADVAYVRFHGRNAKKWWQHEHAWERYDYAYTQEELAEWVPKIKKLDAQAEKTFVFTNNHWRGQAVDTARQLQNLLMPD